MDVMNKISELELFNLRLGEALTSGDMNRVQDVLREAREAGFCRLNVDGKTFDEKSKCHICFGPRPEHPGYIPESGACAGCGRLAPVGRELDALVAERVMGWAVRSEVTMDGPDFVGYPGVPVEALEGSYVASVPRYSTDIGAAWEVVVAVDVRSERDNAEFKLRRTSRLRVGGEWEDAWEATFSRTWIPNGMAEAAPEAICRAALAWAAKKRAPGE